MFEDDAGRKFDVKYIGGGRYAIVKAGMKKCPNCEKRIMAEERNII